MKPIIKKAKREVDAMFLRHHSARTDCGVALFHEAGMEKSSNRFVAVTVGWRETKKGKKSSLEQTTWPPALLHPHQTWRTFQHHQQ
jgi:hypothetical protein